MKIDVRMWLLDLQRTRLALTGANRGCNHSHTRRLHRSMSTETGSRRA